MPIKEPWRSTALTHYVVCPDYALTDGLAAPPTQSCIMVALTNSGQNKFLSAIFSIRLHYTQQVWSQCQGMFMG